MAKAESNDTPEPTVSLTFAQLKELLEAQRDTPEEKIALIKAQAEENAKATKTALRPENERHPGKSVYAYPEGDSARPRPVFQCRTLWLNDELGYDVTTAKEIELMNAVPHGRYSCERPDGSPLKVEVRVERDDLGKAQKKTFWFETRGGLHRNLPGRVAMLNAMIEQAQLVTA